MSKPLGVGIIGAGPVTQAIHLPTLFNPKRPAARLVANPIGVQQLPGASGRLVRLHGRFDGAGGRIQRLRIWPVAPQPSCAP